MRKCVRTTAILLIVSMAFIFSGCFFKSANATKFTDKLQEVFGATEKDYSSKTFTADTTPITGCTRVITYFGREVSTTYIEFDNSQNAYNYFTIYYENFEDIFEADGYSGSFKKGSSGSRGYVYLDGNISTAFASSSKFGLGSVYGGVYYQGNVVVLVVTHGSVDSRIHTSDFLDAIGYPHL